MVHSRIIFVLLLLSSPLGDVFRLSKERSSHRKMIRISKDLDGNVSHSTSQSGTMRLGGDVGPKGLHGNVSHSTRQSGSLRLGEDGGLEAHSNSEQNATNFTEEKDDIDWPHLDRKAESKRTFHPDALMKKPIPPYGDKPTGSLRGGIESLSNVEETKDPTCVAMSLSELRRICTELRIGSLPGPEAAAQLEVAAGLVQPSPPKGKPAKELRTNLEMWVMDEIPVLYRVGDSEELPESLQEDAQAFKITELIAQESKDVQQSMLIDWLKDPPDGAQRNRLATQIMEKVGNIQEASLKKKKAA